MSSFRCLVLITATALLSTADADAQVENSTPLMRKYAAEMLDQIHREIQKTYFDSTFGGVDIEAARERAAAGIAIAAAPSDAFAHISDYTAALRDSHTAFFPPLYADDIEYGFEVTFVGGGAFVSRVKDGSPAAQAGLKVGDRITQFAMTAVDRADFHYHWYKNTILAPVDPLLITLKTPDGVTRRMQIRPSVQHGSTDARSWALRMRIHKELKERYKMLSHKYATVADSVLLWQLPVFAYKDKHLRKLVADARKHDVLILDLRGNSGGAIETLQDLAGMFFDRPVKIGEMKNRKKTETLEATPSKTPFLGRLIVLVDSESASAAEVFARLVQVEKRGLVLGDRTAGAVMVSEIRDYSIGMQQIWFYGASITVSDLTMADGERLEKKGVTPDEVVVPSAADLAAGRDPVLARALALAGVQQTAGL